MLVGEHGGGYEYGHLLAVDGCLEGCAYGHLRLAESHVAAHKAVHWPLFLHVGFHSLSGGKLVGRILVDKRSLKFVLQISVGREGKSFLVAARGIELDKVAGNVFELAFGALFHLLPCSGAYAVYFGGTPSLPRYLASLCRAWIDTKRMSLF